MITYNKNIKEMTLTELREERYQMNKMLCDSCGDLSMVDNIASIVSSIEAEMNRRILIAQGELFDENEAIEVEFEAVADDDVTDDVISHFSVVKYDAETLNTIKDYMEWIETPVGDTNDIYSDRFYNLVKYVTNACPITDSAYELEDIVQDIKYDCVYKFMSYPKMHKYFGYTGYTHEDKMKSIYNMASTYYRSKVKDYISKLNKRNHSIPISKFDHTNDDGTVSNVVEDKLESMVDEYTQDDNKYNNLKSIIDNAIDNKVGINTAKDKADKMRDTYKTALDLFAKGCYDTVDEMCEKNNMNGSSFYNFANRCKSDKEMRSKIMRTTGLYIVDELERQNDWSVEMMETKYNMPENKGVNKGYYDQFKDVGKVFTKKINKSEK